MRILHILDHSLPRRSSYAYRTQAILSQQRALGWHTVQLTGAAQGKDDTAHEQGEGWHFFRTRTERRAWARLPWLAPLAAANALTRRLRQVVKLTRPDLLHAHAPLLNAVAALRVGRHLGLPVVVEIGALAEHAHGDPAGLRQRLTRALEIHVACRADAVTATSDALRADLESRGVPSADITVIPAGATVDPRRAGAIDTGLARRLGLGPGPVIGFAGPFRAHEGVELLLAAMPSLLRVHPGVQLLLVGAGPREGRLRLDAAALGAANRIVFAGPVARERMAPYYALCDMLVYPRLRTPMTDLVTPGQPLEAMAHGRLVLASNVGGHRELLVHGKTGILFEPGSASSVADAVLAVLAEPACWEPLGEAARAFVARERNWATSVARYAPLYAGLLQRTPVR